MTTTVPDTRFGETKNRPYEKVRTKSKKLSLYFSNTLFLFSDILSLRWKVRTHPNKKKTIVSEKELQNNSISSEAMLWLFWSFWPLFVCSLASESTIFHHQSSKQPEDVLALSSQIRLFYQSIVTFLSLEWKKLYKISPLLFLLNEMIQNKWFFSSSDDEKSY